MEENKLECVYQIRSCGSSWASVCVDGGIRREEEVESKEIAEGVEIPIHMICEGKIEEKRENYDENFTSYPKLVGKGNTPVCVCLSVKDICVLSKGFVLEWSCLLISCVTFREYEVLSFYK